ncbi:MAG: membrane-bound lytic murein transglycosylase MltF [Pseudomonadaceae bacterium]|nr:membrane-bound lytic murein transglycosylase MltF [Pseudomonadaceae bacterium]
MKLKKSLLLLLLLMFLVVAGCKQTDPLSQVLKTGTLTVAMRNTPAVFYEHRDGYAGFEYELVKSFADHLGVKLKVINLANALEMEQAVLKGEVDMAAGSLGLTLDRSRRFSATAPLLHSPQMVVYRTGHFRPKSWQDVIERTSLAVLAGSRQAEVLQSQQVLHPHLSWMETEDLEVTDLLKMVQDGDLDYALVSTQDFNINRFFFPRVAVAFDAEVSSALVWLFSKQDHSKLERAATSYINLAQASGTISEVRERYYRHEQYLEYVGAPLFLRHVRTRLPQYESHFRHAAEQQSLDWLLLAAVAFQESHWRKNAVSPTGVRGLMMLTQRTANELNVDRLNPLESIEGGSRYLKQLYDRMPESVQGRDRLYMALASYNVGKGHLEDARKITESQGFNPNSWDDVAKHLPLLTQRKWYRQTRYGYARGNEPVAYVHNIRRYLEILEWHQRSQEGFLELLEERASKVKFETAFRKVPAII